MNDNLKNEIEKAKQELAYEDATSHRLSTVLTQISPPEEFPSTLPPKHHRKQLIIFAILLASYSIVEAYLPYNVKAFANSYSEVLFHIPVLPIFLTQSQKDRITANQLAEVANDVYKESQGVIDVIGAATNYPDHSTQQPLQVQKISNDKFKICADFSTSGSYHDPNGHQDIDYHSGNNCFTYNINFSAFYAKKSAQVKGAYVTGIEGKQRTITALGKSNPDKFGDYMTGTYKADTVVYDVTNKLLSIADLKVGNTADFYFKTVPRNIQEPGLAAGGGEDYIYKIVITNPAIDARYCPHILTLNVANPICPDTYLNLTVRSGQQELSKNLYTNNSEGVQIYVNWTTPPTVINSKSKIIPLNQLLPGQVVDVVWQGDQPIQLKMH